MTESMRSTTIAVTTKGDKMIKYLFFILAILAGCATGPVASKGWSDHFCEKVPGTTATYCYDETVKGATKVGLFFHGLLDDSTVWVSPTSVPSSYPDLIAAMPPLRLFTISFSQPMKVGPFPVKSGWMISDYPGRTLAPADSTIDTFKNIIMPYLEKKYGISGPYVGFGHSMGSSNLATLWADPKTSSMWKSVTLINPAFAATKYDPFHLKVGQECLWCYAVKYNFDNTDQWNTWSPLGTLTKAGKLAPIRITATQTDFPFNLYDGAVEFRDEAKKHATVDWLDSNQGYDHWHFSVPWVVAPLK